MKLLPIILVLIAGEAAALPHLHASEECGQVALKESIEVPAGTFSLATLLADGICPAIVRAAAAVPLGTAPLPGSMRVMSRGEARALLQQLPMILGSKLPLIVPERITIQRSGPRADCTNLAGRILKILSSPSTERPSAAHEIPCDLAKGIPDEAEIEITRRFWDPGLQRWKVFVRCVRAADCVPFLVLVQGSKPEPELNHPSSSCPNVDGSPLRRADLKRVPDHSPDAMPVRRGQHLILLWDEKGIRLSVPVVSLDAGRAGELVRARIARGTRIVRATVVGGGVLRATD